MINKMEKNNISWFIDSLFYDVILYNYTKLLGFYLQFAVL